MRKIGVFGVILVLALVGCTKDKVVSAAGDSTVNDPHVVATVGDMKIMDTDIEAIMSQIPEEVRAQYDSAEGKRAFVSSLTEVKVMAMEARKKGIDKDPDMKFKLDFMSEQVLARGLAESAVKDITITDEEITQYYNENKDKLTEGPKAKLRHILVDKEDAAKAVHAQLLKGDDFSKIAQEKSKCPSSKNGGDLGWVSKGMTVPEFENAAFALKKGEMSGVVKTSFGYHVIICDEIEDAKTKDLAEAKDSIRQQIREERSKDVVEKLMEQARKDFPVSLNEQYFKTAQEEAAKAAPMPQEEPTPADSAQ